jgi:hypothetical protein
MDLRAPGKKDKMLPVVNPNRSTQAEYKAALAKAVANMTASYQYWIDSKYRRAVAANADAGRVPDVDSALHALDASETPKGSANDMFAELTRLQAYWSNYFNDFAKKLASQISFKWQRDNSTSWQGNLKRAGFDIKMQVTPSQKLIMDAKIQENVALIKSIQEQYHTDIVGAVTRSFLKGRDLDGLSKEIKKRGNVSTNRAAFIARDQSNKATAQFNSARQRELGIKFAKWVHSSAGKEPRATHVRAGRESWVFDTQVGIDFKDGFGNVIPGEAIGCKCVSRAIIPAIGRGDIESYDDLDAVGGYPGAYTAKAGKSAGPKQKQDVTQTRLPGERVKYS